MKKHNGVILKNIKEYKNVLLNEMYPNQLQKNYNFLKNKNFYLQIDGSQDRRFKNIYNVIGGLLTEKKRGKSILLE